MLDISNLIVLAQDGSTIAGKLTSASKASTGVQILILEDLEILIVNGLQRE